MPPFDSMRAAAASTSATEKYCTHSAGPVSRCSGFRNPAIGRGPIIAIATIMVARMIIAESALSFLGLGVRPPTASWGSMLNDSQSLLLGVPRLTLYPAVLISMAVFGFNLFGEGLRDAFDPKD